MEYRAEDVVVTVDGQKLKPVKCSEITGGTPVYHVISRRKEGDIWYIELEEEK